MVHSDKAQEARKFTPQADGNLTPLLFNEKPQLYRTRLAVRGRIVAAASGLAPLAETRLFAAQPVRKHQNHWLHTAAASGANQLSQYGFSH
jgi:hypothetical protein